MATALAIFGVTFAAFCVWLTVRIVNRRERWAKRLAVGLLTFVLVAYPLSLGPWIWMYHRGYIPVDVQGIPIYAPIQWVEDQGPDAVGEVIKWYMDLWQPIRD